MVTARKVRPDIMDHTGIFRAGGASLSCAVGGFLMFAVMAALCVCGLKILPAGEMTMIDVAFIDKGEMRMGSPYNMYDIRLSGEWVPDLKEYDWQNTHAKGPDGKLPARLQSFSRGMIVRHDGTDGP